MKFFNGLGKGMPGQVYDTPKWGIFIRASSNEAKATFSDNNRARAVFRSMGIESFSGSFDKGRGEFKVRLNKPDTQRILNGELSIPIENISVHPRHLPVGLRVLSEKDLHRASLGMQF